MWDIPRMRGRRGEIEMEVKCKNSLFIVQFLGEMNWLGERNRRLSRHGNPGINWAYRYSPHLEDKWGAQGGSTRIYRLGDTSSSTNK
jgi:hypothetical protein